MKKLIVIMIASFIPVLLSAQDTPLSSLYDRYVSESGFETTEILPGSMSFEWEQTQENPQIKEMLQNVKSVRIVKYKAESGVADMDKYWRKIRKTAGDEQYTEVVTVNSDDVQVYMYMLKGAAGTTREVALLEKDKNGVMMVTVTGNMDFSSMFSPENMQGLREMGEYYMKNKGDCKADGQE